MAAWLSGRSEPFQGSPSLVTDAGLALIGMFDWAYVFIYQFAGVDIIVPVCDTISMGVINLYTFLIFTSKLLHGTYDASNPDSASLCNLLPLMLRSDSTQKDRAAIDLARLESERVTVLSAVHLHACT